mgnify:FL=1
MRKGSLDANGTEELLKYQEALLETSKKQVEEGKARYEAGQILESDYLLLEAQHATDLHNVTSTKISLDNSLVALKNLMAMDLSYPIELVYPDDSAMESMMRMPSQQEVVNRGMQTMPDVRISYYSVLIAEQGLKVSKSGYSPTLSLSAGVGSGHTKNFNNYGTQVNDKFTPQAGLSLSIPIFNASRTRTNVKQSRIALEQAELERNQFLSDNEKSLMSEYGSVGSSGSQYRESETRQNAYTSSV